MSWFTLLFLKVMLATSKLNLLKLVLCNEDAVDVLGVSNV